MLSLVVLIVVVADDDVSVNGGDDPSLADSVDDCDDASVDDASVDDVEENDINVDNVEFSSPSVSFVVVNVESVGVGDVLFSDSVWFEVAVVGLVLFVYSAGDVLVDVETVVVVILDVFDMPVVVTGEGVVVANISVEQFLTPDVDSSKL